MDVFNAIVKFFQEGGVFMYPIMLVFALGAAIALERYMYLSLAKRTNRTTWDKLTPLVKANNYDHALEISNDSEFGLTSGIITQSLKYAAHFKRHSKSGCVMVNLPTAGTDYHVPFGGRKASSYGPREQGQYAQEFYTVVKTNYSKPY